MSRRAAWLLFPAFLALSSLAAGNSETSGRTSGGGCGSSSGDTAPLLLSSLRVDGAGEMTPAFSPQVFHYAVRCEERQILSVSAEADGAGAALLLNGQAAGGVLTDARVLMAGDEDLAVELSRPGTDGRTVYVVHCVPPDFPDIEIVSKEPGTAPGLLLVTPHYSPSGSRERVSYLAMLDDNGVPRFLRRVTPGAHNFRWHESVRRYSYAETLLNNPGEVVLLDESLEEVGRVGTVGGLAPAMMHDFLITDEGSYLFIVNNPVTRDLSSYPAREGESAPSSAEATHDSVIQEVSPDGREVFRWNSWDHLKLSDCNTWRQFPEEYAKLNSLSLSEGNIVASFRACSQVLRIERPSGRVIWQLGGSDPAEPDSYDGRRPVFDDRPWYRVAGDPLGGFCAQHATLETASGRVLMFDNGQCPDGDRPASRVVEYRLGAGGEAAFLRHYEIGRLSGYAGAVALLENGNWLVSWGGGGIGAALSEVDPSGRELLVLRFFKGAAPSMTYRAYRHTGPEPPLRLPRSEEAAKERAETLADGNGSI